jgi:hypothetical protein
MAAPPIIPRNHEQDDVKYLGDTMPTIERILECAVALTWKDLTNGGEATSIQVEYRTKTNRSLESLKFWSSTTRGAWHLVCDYRTDSTSTQERGVTFNVGHRSEDLAGMLDAIMQHQDAFAEAPSEFLDGLIHIGGPTEIELIAARKDMSEAMGRIAALPAHA